ncbi:CesT family type III secretion system chaperone [Morganella morganii]|uniref:type III secretion system chaperone n=1 Tax=Morganella morganii TaxID=582 RepID=UPI00164AD6AC|nr:type III secretion system chaperone [Morganella morganii]MBC4011025.1 CesT family type III secretion system chaperone [Morganella morganii]MCF1267354.1 type III secretion system chaperone [Morganella morganii]
MQDLSLFHRTAMMLLQHIGLDTPQPATDQHTFMLTIDSRYSLSLAVIDETEWYLSANIGELPHITQSNELLQKILKLNTLTQLSGQPVISLNEKNEWVVWSRLALGGTEDSHIIELFEYILKSADYLLDLH